MELLRGVSAANNFVLALVPLLSWQLFNSRSRPGGGVSNAARMQKNDPRHRRLLRARRERRRHFEAERLGRLEVDEQLNFRGLLDRKISLAFRP
jgi:hypothetical protein